MGRRACTEPQCLYKGKLYLYLYLCRKSKKTGKKQLQFFWPELKAEFVNDHRAKKRKKWVAQSSRIEGHRASQDSATILTFLRSEQKLSPERLIFFFNTVPTIAPSSASCLLHITVLPPLVMRWLLDIYKICIPLEKAYKNITAVGIRYEDYVSSLTEHVLILNVW